MPELLVGSATARAVHGSSSGADCVLLTPHPVPARSPHPEPVEGPNSLAAVITEVCHPATLETATDLDHLVRLAASGDGPLVIAAGDLRLSLPATLDLLDAPGDRTALLLADPRNIEAPRQTEHGLHQATLARVGPDGTVLSTSTARHTVGNPNRVVVGLLRIAAADRRRAADLWRAASREGLADLDPFDVALLALVRAGLVIKETPLGYHDWSRGGLGMDGLGPSPWRQRLRSASRLGDGAYSTAVVRPLSRIGTRLALRIDLSPNAITVISLAVGLVAALLVLTGRPAGWIAAAVLLQLALVIDCMDGEVARFTRRFSALGAWLDGIGDRIKEYAIFAAVASVAAREGQPVGWLLAVIALAIVTARHLEDSSYSDRSAPDRVSTLHPLPLDRTDDGTAADRTRLPDPPGRRAVIIFWAKKVAHVPIAERYLVLSLALLTLRPLLVLGAAIAVSLFALVWTFGGRFLRALRTRPPAGGAALDRHLDLGLIAGALGRSLARHPRRLGWLALPVLWLIECAVLVCFLAFGAYGWLVFGTVAVLAFRRYALIYSIRPQAGPEPRRLGAEVRVLLVAAVALAGYAISGAVGVLTAGLVVIALATIADSAIGALARRSARSV